VARSAEEYGPAESRHPTLGRAKAPWRTALPARRHGRLLGVLELAWPARPTDLTDAVRRRLRALTEICALSLPDRQAKRAREPGADEEPPTSLLDAVLDPAMLLQPVLGSGGEVTDFRILRVNSRFLDPEGRPPHSVENRTLIEAYPLASAGGLLVRLLHVHTTGEAIQGEELLLSFLIGELPQPTALEIAAGRTDQGLVLCWRFEESDARQAALLNNAGRLARLGGFEENLVTGAIHWNQGLYELHGLPTDAEPTPFAALPAHVHPDDEQAVRRLVRSILGQRKEASAVFRLIHPGGLTRYTRVVAEPVIDANGRLRGVQGAYQDVSAQHWTEIALSATRERLADTEQQASERHRLALRLQQAIMPPEPPPLDAAGLATAARYRPAAQEECVGGDWYDAVLLPDRTALLVVGDMAGHGIEAATGMVALRNALRGLAVTGAGPAQLLAWLNTAADALSDPATATAICARYDPASRELRWARAGHLPPLLVRGGHARLLPMPHGVLIGADPDAEYEEDTLVLEPGDVLLLYTDGLVERRDQSVEDSLCRLVDGLGDPIDDLGGFLDRLLDRSTADTDDDTSLIAVRVADGRRPAEVPGSRTEA
jgi:serine phosphatase RsbU (regulator of sigma subunit)